MTAVNTAVTPSVPRSRRRLEVIGVVMVLVAVALGSLFWLTRGKGYWSSVKRHLLAWTGNLPTTIVACTPGDRERDVDLDAIITATVEGGRVDAKTLEKGVHLIRTHDEVVMAAAFTLDDAGTRITIKPDAPLAPKTKYTVLITPDLCNAKGGPVAYFKSNFTTRGNPDPEIQFEKVALQTAQGNGFTAVVRGHASERSLYAASDDGRIFRFPILPDGTLGVPFTSDAVKRANGVNRLISGFCLDPTSTSDHPVLWVTHNHFGFAQVDNWGGKISRVSGPHLDIVEDVVVNLPRSFKDHTTFQPNIGPDGALYFHQGSASAYGDPDEEWGMRAESMLSASVLRLDLAKVTPGVPIDVKTVDAGGPYDPRSTGAPLTLYARGLRVAYDLLWASNGRLYAPVNGSSQGGNLPGGDGAPAIKNLPYTEPDYLYDVEQGKYYGHPNPSIGKFILNGGNPTDHVDVAEIPQYPVGTMPDPEWDPPLYDFGAHVSANGIEEYLGDAFGGRLRNKLLVCRYNFGSDLIVLTVGPDGKITNAQVGTTGMTDFVNPLDVVEDRVTGNLYVAEYGGRRITLLRPLRTASRADP